MKFGFGGVPKTIKPISTSSSNLFSGSVISPSSSTNPENNTATVIPTISQENKMKLLNFCQRHFVNYLGCIICIDSDNKSIEGMELSKNTTCINENTDTIINNNNSTINKGSALLRLLQNTNINNNINDPLINYPYKDFFLQKLKKFHTIITQFVQYRI